ncbi:MAG: serine/threonine protein kinase [Acidobacteria bacterium]|nr:MAG: serine/threonine protein kinase [Acidobacteriota bacterium]REK01524.1 MAG: serine/threonine protein kinase [Acidobacteriota bacterium]REK14480.1 MAG: serine/threonine protein kinase [Acidobacteriota bacterium]REK45195.1 MAG: serine/threonine protein kinase [Acidobacteriota bacterium]
MSASTSEKIGRYKVLSEIGEGGMGKVFLAEDSDLGRKVALKVLPEKFSVDSEGLDRFKQEARAASALNHPNIITVYEVGESEETNFIATEFIDGKTLRERMDGEKLSFDEVLSIVIQTAEALSAAHDAGIVHRDVKPENIMLRPDGYVKILDFGLAKLAENTVPSGDSEDMTRKLVKTHPGVVMGTVAYMSPEQARGKEIDARSDVFSFGVVLYELLGGQPPFQGETMTDILAAIINSEPPPLKSLAPHLPPELLRIVGKTLKKRKEQRYHSTRDLLVDLKELRDELLLEAKLESTAVPDRPEGKPTGSATPASTDGNKDALLLTEFENLTGEAIFDQTLKTALAFSLSQSPFLDIFPDTKVRQTLGWMGRTGDEKVTKELAYEICLRQGLKAFITGTISSIGTTFVITLEAINARSGESLGRQFEQVNSKEDVLTALSSAATGLREQLGESLSSIQKYDIPVEFATTSSLEALEYFTLAYEQQNTGKTLEAIPFYKKALEYDPNFASVYSGLGVIYANTEQWTLASEMVEKAYELRHSVSENEKLRIVYFYYKLVTGEVDKAIDTLEVWRRTYPSHVVALVNLADSYERIGQSEKAVEVAYGAMKLDSNNAIAYMNLAESLLSLGRMDEFKEVCEKATQKNLDGDYFHMLPYMVAFMEGDQEEMNRHLAWFNGRPDEYLALDLRTGSAAFNGQWRKAQDFSRKSVEQAARSGAREVAAQFAAEQAIRIAFWRSGRGLPEPGGSQLSSVLRTQTNKALSYERSAVALSLSAIALAVGGLSDEAFELVSELRESRSKDTLINELWIPTVRAALELQNGRPKDAIEALEPAERFEREGYFYQRYLRAFAFEALGYPDDALREFVKILDNRTESVLSSIYPLAQLGKARILKDKEEYEKFFELWKNADDDMPALVAAKAEFGEL